MHATHYMPRLFCQRIWNKSGLALFAGSIVLATVAEAEGSNTEIQREKVAAEEDQQAQQNASLPTAQRSALETELKNAQERAQLAEKMADLAKSQQSVLETELKKALERAQLAEKKAGLNERKLSALEAALAEKDDELKNARERAQLAEKNADVSDPNAGPKADHLASIQPSESSVRSAETTAGPASNSVPAAIESRNENSGIGFAEATTLWTSREVQSLKELILAYHRLTMISPQENFFLQIGAPDSTQTPVSALASEINRPNASPESSGRGHDSARVIPPKILNLRHRSYVRSRFLDVKARLIALWHQSWREVNEVAAGQDSGIRMHGKSRKSAKGKPSASPAESNFATGSQ